jgi:acyl-CoA synthetase (AMP-forming)/AMP-acid ligase II
MEEIALRDERVAWTWNEVDARLAAVRARIAACHLGEGRVAVYAENSAETVLAHLGPMLAGASTVAVNFHLTPDEAAFILRDSDTRVLLVGPENLGRGVVAAEAAGVDTVVVWRAPSGEPLPGARASVVRWDDWLEDTDDATPPSLDAVAPRPHLMYTSGTTGVPKGVEMAPPMFPRTASVAEHVEAFSAINRFVGVGPHLVVGPMYHTGPLNGMRCMLGRTPLVVLSRFDPEAVLDAIERWAIATSVMVPTHFTRMLHLPAEARARHDLSSLRIVAHTGAACPIDVKHRMIDWFGPVFIDAYGATEVGTICSINSTDWLAHPGSVGRCIDPPFARAIVVDEDGNELPAGEEGRLYFEDVTGRGIVYPGDPDKTAAAHLRPGVFTIGEIGYVDADGFVYLTDRFSDMIVSGGVNVYPAEAEQVIIEHPGVADVAVIGVPDADMGESVRALVVPVDPQVPPSADEIIALCRSRLAGYKCPRSVEIVESVGRNAMGKVNKRALRSPYWS